MAAAMRKLPNLKICVENTDDLSESEDEIVVDEDDDRREEGEIDSTTDESGDEVQFSVSIRDAQQLPPPGGAGHAAGRGPKKSMTLFQGEKKYENRSGDFVTGFDITSKEYQERKAKRAKRFGIEDEVTSVSMEDRKMLYESLGITEETMCKGERGIRPEAIHVRGTENMSTQDVFAYFKDFAPGTIEWIDDSSCNVVWLDPMTAARAIINLSTACHDEWKRMEKVKRKADDKTAEESLTKPDQAQDDDDDDLDLTCGEVNKENEATTNVSMEVCVDAETGEVSGEEMEVERGKVTDEAMQMNDDTQTEEVKVIDSELSDYTSNDEDDDDSIVTKRQRRKNRGNVEGVDDEHTVAKEESKHAGNGSHVESEIEKPPGKWRVGVKLHHKANNLFLRFATKADKKQPGAEKRSKYYQKYGNPNYHGMRGLISGSRKRKLRSETRKEQSREAREVIDKARSREEESTEERPKFPKSDWLYNVAEELYDDQRLIDLDTPQLDNEKERLESLRAEKEEAYKMRMDEIRRKRQQPSSPEPPVLRMDDPKMRHRGRMKPSYVQEEQEDDEDSDSSDSVGMRVPVLPIPCRDSSEEEDLSLLIPAKKKLTMKMYADEEEEKLTKQSYTKSSSTGDARARIQNLKLKRQQESENSRTLHTSSNDLRRKLEGRKKPDKFRDYPSLVVEVFETDDD